jgi:hypothetical protein
MIDFDKNIKFEGLIRKQCFLENMKLGEKIKCIKLQ